ncbi:PREDICTED: ras-related protein Rap-2c-like isoform X3 [Branchiostoma belcheri]|uniref:Ras-related protein Rap-2c-like isoform X3 n=1 Tax=Branchiostoma belcheri TaxID=7741 RepID=A0A6P4YDW7_BRABE|nr:PREDICTED: ras-related protein Rap-2c-like isoform X3 [Branchiostoma belcheri]
MAEKGVHFFDEPVDRRHTCLLGIPEDRLALKRHSLPVVPQIRISENTHDSIFDDDDDGDEWWTDQSVSSMDDLLGKSVPEYRVVVMGSAAVGKTSLRIEFCTTEIIREFIDEDDSMMLDMNERTFSVDGMETTLHLTDTSGHNYVRRRDQYIPKGDAYLIVYAINDRESFKTASKLLIKLRRSRPLHDIPVILVGNKRDLERSREVKKKEGIACAKVMECKFIETSTTIRHNIDELFEGVVRQIRLRSNVEERDSELMQKMTSSERRGSKGILGKAKNLLTSMLPKKRRNRLVSSSCNDLSVL